VIVAVSVMRDEADICEWAVAHLINEGVDHLIIGDNMSRDATNEILSGFDRVTVVRDMDPMHNQHYKMTAYARQAAEMGADWVLPFDADECWYWPHGTLADFFESCDANKVNGRGWDHLVTEGDDPTDPNPFTRITHRRRDRQRLPKVAFRPHERMFVDMGNHNVFLDVNGDPANMAHFPGPHTEGLEYRHFQYRSLDQMARKVRQGAAASAGLNGTSNTHWRDLAVLCDDELEVRWLELCAEPDLIFDPAPVRRL
jgi:hypothetical protein